MNSSQLNPEAFLARFFNAEMLSHHAELLGKSGKGNESVLAARIAKVRELPDCAYVCMRVIRSANDVIYIIYTYKTYTHTHTNTHTHTHTYTHTKEWQRGGFRVAASGEAASGDVSNTAAAQETPQKKRKVHTHTHKHTHTNLGIVA